MTELRKLTPHQAIPEEQSRRDARQRQRLRTFLPELIQLERLLAEAPESVSVRVPQRVTLADLTLPIYRIDLGAERRDVPALLLVGGVHGLERIGSQVVMAWLHTLLSRLAWDDHLARLLTQVRVTVLPILNPGGMFLNQRSNPNGVDLMRNAPITAQDRSAFLLGGQRLSRRLPWYTGDPEQGMEPENQALAAVIEELAARPAVQRFPGLPQRLWLAGPDLVSLRLPPAPDAPHRITDGAQADLGAGLPEPHLPVRTSVPALPDPR